MPFFGARQRRVRCFYCNTTVSCPPQPGPVRQLECPNCLAVNYFDDNGEITDPPLGSTANPAANVQYARAPAPRSTSPSAAFVFCEQCQRHQSMLHIAKSNLNPPLEGTPEYDQFKEHLRQLEIRYPQVCSFCRPGARQRIKDSMHDARSRQMLSVIKDTRAARIHAISGWPRLWRSGVLSLGGWGCFVGIAGHSLWHLLGARTSEFNSTLDDAFSIAELLSGHQTYQDRILAFYQQLATAQVDSRVFALASSWVPAMLILSLLTFWWNPRLRQKYIDLSRGRLVGLRDYYITQLVLIALRLGSILLLSQPSRAGLDNKTARNIHIISALIITVLAFRASNNVHLTTKPPVQFRRLDDADILPETPRASRAGPALKQTDPEHPLIAARRDKPKFDMAMLSPQQQDAPAAPQQETRTPARWPEPYAAQAQPAPTLSRSNLQSHTHAAAAAALPPPTAMDIDDPPQSQPPPSSTSSSFTASLRADLPHYALRSRTAPTPAAQARTQALQPSRDRWTAHRRPRDAPDDATTDASAPDVRPLADLDDAPARELVLQPTRLWLPADRADTGLEDMFAQVLGSTAFAEPEGDAASRGADGVRREAARATGGAAGWVGGAVAASLWAGVLGGVWAFVKAYRA